ncbi:hypothetical protein P618_200775 [Holospora obtusa F1]|uniref:Uncharacterized protein n=1 Tax=Holospora obtusa F1 TaxID=1399147 RepID=W6TDY0_HOLOB|nr:hypothetical protein [Holospora obtusa]ETZ07041.1 hypothetical protein P618_200775 [Holospora obtusa F1]
MKKVISIFLGNIFFQVYGFESELICWIRDAEKRLCDDPKQCQRYLALTAKGKALVLQELLRRSKEAKNVSEIHLINWVLKQYQ